MKSSRFTFLFLLSVFFMGANAHAEHNCARDGFAFASLKGVAHGAAFMTLHNPTDKEWNITNVTSDRAARTELHDHEHHAQGVMRMVHLKQLTIPAGASVSLAPSGKHVMLFDVKTPLVAGESFTVVFSDNSHIVCTVPITVRDR
ncbi:MAG: copper chaperone PCu(A)C [Alphaproteobacteria bacterium]|nr:MAG: copper chaperone PCu(A)C [Alphaproteobacteria bacterium]